MRDAMLEYFAQGFSKKDVSNALGVAEEVLDEYLRTPEFAADLAKKKVSYQQERVEKRYNKLEEAILMQIEENLPFAEFPHLVRALEGIAKNKVAYRSPANTPAGVMVHNTINVLMPDAARNQTVQLNSNNEVVAIGERTMASMPIEGVKSLFKKLDTEKVNVPAIKQHPHTIDLADLTS